ncbi:MAG: serine/threonine-protein kinase, partial [Pyrinomonadaceae bacterium]
MPPKYDHQNLRQPSPSSSASAAPVDQSAPQESSIATASAPSVPVLNQTAMPAPEDLIGMTLGGRYFVEKELGHGGIGAIYLARDRRLLDKPVVVKVLLEKSLQNEWAVRKFQQEKEALTRVDHPGIVGILDTGELPDGKPYLVMQYVDGAPLRSIMRPEGMGFERAACVLKQVCAALGAVHEKGIYHRDLKPENVMLQSLDGGDEQIKIIDFGIAKVRNSLIAPSTIAPIMAGTIIYMSPEQLRGEKVETAASDIYALGVIAYEMVTGRRPFKPETLFQLMEMQREGVRLKPKELRPALPESAQAAILRALSFEPEDRYKRARDFGDAMEQALTGDAENAACDIYGEASTKSLTIDAPPAHVVQKRAGRLALFIVAASLLIGAVSFLIWSGLRAKNNEQAHQEGVVTSATASTVSERSLSYWLTVQKMRDGKPYQEPFESSGQEIFENGYKFRLNAESEQAGYLYLLNEGLDSQGAKSLTLLYPTPKRNEGSARLDANHQMQTGWNNFGGQSGTEKFWMVWSASPVNELEAARDAAFKSEKGAIDDSALARKTRAFLTEHSAQKPVVTKDTAKKQSLVKGAGDILV